MFEICITITTSILSGLLLFFIKENYNLKKKEKEAEKEKNQKEAEKQQDRDDLLLGVARVLLINMMQDAIDRGHTTQAEYEVIDELYKPYIKNGGNGMVKHLFEDRYKHIKVKHE